MLPVPVVADDAPLDEAPPLVEPPAPPEAPLEPTPEQIAAQQAIDQQLVAARVGLGDAQTRLASVQSEILAMETLLAAAQARLPEETAAVTLATAQLADAEARLRRWAITLYAGNSLAPVEFLLDSSFNDLPRRVGLVKGVVASVRDDIKQHRDRQQATDGATRETAAQVADVIQSLETARRYSAAVAEEVASWEQAVEALAAGQEVAVAAIAFPVDGPNRFSDTFGAPRMTGTRFSHSHQGVDIFAAPGTPIVAFERGVLARVGSDVLGGKKLWLVGQSGTYYYYAHLQGYAPGMVDGLIVEAGQLLASVGNTGNALRTPHHLHFEIRPDGGEAINPTPLLRQVAEATVAAATAAGGAVPPAPGPG